MRSICYVGESEEVAFYRLRLRGVDYPCRLCRDGDHLIASADVPTRLGVVVVSARVDLQQVRAAFEAMGGAALARRLKQAVAVSGDDSDSELLAVGDAWKDFTAFFSKTIPNEVNKVAKTKAFGDVSKGINTVTTHPAYDAAMMAVNVIPGYGQVISVAMAGTKMAAGGMNLLARGKSGEPAAVAAISTLSSEAQAGDPNAAKAMATLGALNGFTAENPAAAQALQASSQGGGYGFAAPNAQPTDFNTVAGDLPGFATGAQYDDMRRRYARRRRVIDMAAGDDGSFSVAPRVRYGLPPPSAYAAR